jgi:hypothetical protein
MKFIFYTDPGHGWLKVKKDLLLILGITDKISHCSYEKDLYAYLEDDDDASKFIEAYEKAYNEKPEFIYKNSNKSSKIRSYQQFYDFNKWGYGRGN